MSDLREEVTPTCTQDEDCGEGKVCKDGECVDKEPEPTPEPTCTEDSDCGEGKVCVEGECVEPPPDLNIGRVIIARGSIPWDAEPPAWDDLVPTCCPEPTPEPDNG